MKPYVRRRSLENSYWYMGHLSSALATGDDTGGALALFDVSIRPGMEPPPHVHSREAEALYILEGRLTGWASSARLTAGPGQLANLPNHEPHGWKFAPGPDGATARGLLILVPSAMDQYFLKSSEPAPALEMPPIHDNQYVVRMQKELSLMLADAATFGIQWMPPDYAPVLQDTLEMPMPELNVIGEIYRPLALAAETGGAFTALEWNSPPDSRMPRHLHHHADEAFYILSGEVAFTAGENFEITARPGDFVFLPKGVPHCHRATGGAPARAFQLQTPGGIESALCEVSSLSPEEITLERLLAIGERHGLTLLPE